MRMVRLLVKYSFYEKTMRGQTKFVKKNIKSGMDNDAESTAV